MVLKPNVMQSQGNMVLNCADEEFHVIDCRYCTDFIGLLHVLGVTVSGSFMRDARQEVLSCIGLRRSSRGAIVSYMVAADNSVAPKSEAEHFEKQHTQTHSNL